MAALSRAIIIGVTNGLWDVGAGLSDETVKNEIPCRSRFWHDKDPSLLKGP